MVYWSWRNADRKNEDLTKGAYEDEKNPVCPLTRCPFAFVLHLLSHPHREIIIIEVPCKYYHNYYYYTILQIHSPRLVLPLE